MNGDIDEVHLNDDTTHSPQNRLIKNNINGKLSKYQSINCIQSSKVRHFNENENEFNENYQSEDNLGKCKSYISLDYFKYFSLIITKPIL